MQNLNRISFLVGFLAVFIISQSWSTETIVDTEETVLGECPPPSVDDFEYDNSTRGRSCSKDDECGEFERCCFWAKHFECKEVKEVIGTFMREHLDGK